MSEQRRIPSIAQPELTAIWAVSIITVLAGLAVAAARTASEGVLFAEAVAVGFWPFFLVAPIYWSDRISRADAHAMTNRAVIATGVLVLAMVVLRHAWSTAGAAQVLPLIAALMFLPVPRRFGATITAGSAHLGASLAALACGAIAGAWIEPHSVAPAFLILGIGLGAYHFLVMGWLLTREAARSD